MSNEERIVRTGPITDKAGEQTLTPTDESQAIIDRDCEALRLKVDATWGAEIEEHYAAIRQACKNVGLHLIMFAGRSIHARTIARGGLQTAEDHKLPDVFALSIGIIRGSYSPQEEIVNLPLNDEPNAPMVPVSTIRLLPTDIPGIRAAAVKAMNAAALEEASGGGEREFADGHPS